MNYQDQDDYRSERIQEIKDQEVTRLLGTPDAIAEVLERIYDFPTHEWEFNQCVEDLVHKKNMESAEALIHFLECCAHAQAFQHAIKAYDAEMEEAREAEAENYHFHRRLDSAA